MENIVQSFKMRKNKPIDTRFSVESLATLNIEIPVPLRYSGLIFYIVNENSFYYFENDLNTPILFGNSNSGTSVASISVINNNYSNINNLLEPHQSPGKIIYINPLDICVIYDESTWKYLAGVYKVPNTTAYNTIPNNLLEAERIVIVDDMKFVINSDMTISTQLIEISSIPDVVENDRFYLINGFLYYGINSILYKIGEKIQTYNVVLPPDTLTIEHNLNSINIIALFRINENNGPFVNAGQTIMLDYRVINEYVINIVSKIEISGTLVLIAK